MVIGQNILGDAARDRLLAAAIEAGRIVLAHRAAGVAAEVKADKSLVSAADRDAEAVLLAALAEVAPDMPVVAEEEVAAGRIPAIARRFFLVDALDGTREYLGGGDDFTINIGLIEDGAPLFGIVHAPASATIHWGDVASREAKAARVDEAGTIVDIRPIGCSAAAAPPRAVASKSHANPETETYLTACGAGPRLSIGSSLKFLLVAEGKADLYPRTGPTMEWDTAAGDAVLRAAGGITRGLDGAPLRYGKDRFFNPGFVATAAGVDVPALGGYLAA